MSMKPSEENAGLSVESLPAAVPANDRSDGAPGSGVFAHLRVVWSEYLTENRRGWSKLAEEQARNPTLG